MGSEGWIKARERGYPHPMPKISSSRAKTVVSPKKPAPKAKTKTEKKKVGPKDAFSPRGKSVGGRGSDVKKVLVGGTGSDRSTREQRELRERLNNVFVGGRGSDRSPISFTDYNVGGGRNS